MKKEGEGSVVYIYIYADHACHTSDLVIEEDSHTKMEKSEEESSNVGEGEEEEEEEEEIMPLGKKKKKEEEEFVPTIIKREEEEEEQFHDQISERAQQLSPEQQKIVDLVAQGKVWIKKNSRLHLLLWRNSIHLFWWIRALIFEQILWPNVPCRRC